MWKVMKAKMRMSNLIDLHILLIGKILANEDFNKGRLVDLPNKMVKLGSVNIILTIRKRMGLECNQKNKPERVLSHDHCVTSARSTTWVVVLMHRIAITMEKLDTWLEIVITATTVGNLAILLLIVLSKEKLSRSRVRHWIRCLNCLKLCVMFHCLLVWRLIARFLFQSRNRWNRLTGIASWFTSLRNGWLWCHTRYGLVVTV